MAACSKAGRHKESWALLESMEAPGIIADKSVAVIT